MSDPVLRSMDVIKDSLVDIAIQALIALEDGRIDWKEGAVLAGSAMNAGMRIVGALQRLQAEDLETLITKLRHSDLV